MARTSNHEPNFDKLRLGALDDLRKCGIDAHACGLSKLDTTELCELRNQVWVAMGRNADAAVRKATGH